MKSLHVIAGDLYGNIHFDIEAQDTSIDNIKHALEDCYETWSAKLRKTMGGFIRVSDDQRCVANGQILWWWNGTYSIRLDLAHQESKSQGSSDDTSVCHEHSQTQVRNSPACCGFV